MPVTFYMDAHVPAAITEQLRRRGVEILAKNRALTDPNELPPKSSLRSDHDLTV